MGMMATCARRVVVTTSHLVLNGGHGATGPPVDAVGDLAEGVAGVAAVAAAAGSACGVDEQPRHGLAGREHLPGRHGVRGQELVAREVGELVLAELVRELPAPVWWPRCTPRSGSTPGTGGADPRRSRRSGCARHATRGSGPSLAARRRTPRRRPTSGGWRTGGRGLENVTRQPWPSLGAHQCDQSSSHGCSSGLK